MDKRIIGIIFGVLVILSFLVFIILKDNPGIGNSVEDSNAELEKYRSPEIPEECRLPDYENDLDYWKEHLSHHQNTLYCLEEYYK